MKHKTRIRLVSCTGSKMREFTRSISTGTRVVITDRSVFVLSRYAPDKDGNNTIHEFVETTAVRIK